LESNKLELLLRHLCERHAAAAHPGSVAERSEFPVKAAPSAPAPLVKMRNNFFPLPPPLAVIIRPWLMG
jgi:hypothetical protein